MNELLTCDEKQDILCFSELHLSSRLQGRRDLSATTLTKQSIDGVRKHVQPNRQLKLYQTILPPVLEMHRRRRHHRRCLVVPTVSWSECLK
jgi:hypothetical protein